MIAADILQESKNFFKGYLQYILSCHIKYQIVFLGIIVFFFLPINFDVSGSVSFACCIVTWSCAHIGYRGIVMLGCKLDWSLWRRISPLRRSLAIESYFCCRRNVTQIVCNATRPRLSGSEEKMSFLSHTSVPEKEKKML